MSLTLGKIQARMKKTVPIANEPIANSVENFPAVLRIYDIVFRFNYYKVLCFSKLMCKKIVSVFELIFPARQCDQ